jgi:RNA polymerase sigma factor (sigma-70 family)
MALGRSAGVSVLSDLQTLLDAGVVGGSTDAQLLERVASRGEGGDAAFAVLVARYGPMVHRVCRRILSHSQDAEDAFQATFLVLSLKAGRLQRPDLLANWLYGVAFRVAAKAKANDIRRRVHEQRRMAMTPEAVSPEGRSELLEALDEEIHQLPSKYRVPVVLCYLKGMSRDEAARHLGCPVGTIESWLSRARARLRSRLARRGVALPAGLLAMLLIRESEAASIALPRACVDAAVSIAIRSQGARVMVAWMVPAPIMALTRGVVGHMLVNKIKIVVAMALMGLCAGAGVFATRVPGAWSPDDVATGVSRTDRRTQKQNKPAGDQRRFQGTWSAVSGKEQAKDVPEDALKDFKITFSGDKVTIHRPAGERNGTFKLDPSRKPSGIDMAFEVMGQTVTVLGVYAFDGENLRICFSEPDDERPADLDGKVGSLRVLRRGEG